jgi:excisionase family DNA binding protein
MTKKPKNPLQLAAELEPVCSLLEQSGQTAFSRTVSEAMAALRAHAPVKPPPGGVLTTGQAADALGVRSVNTIKRWVHDGLLEGFRLGGRVMVSQRSVQQFADKSITSGQRAWEDRVAAALEPFDAAENDELPSEDMTWVGRRPWENDVTPAAEGATPQRTE